ncbi:MAG: hypothetical protein D6778_09525 [Nitrospirae bacterium]|nr:MAG: hypothetical protein D6778_09525 [Nitrospirota bacterium]
MPYLVVPAAGLGKRMKRVNPDLPKELLPLAGMPVIHYALEEAITAELRDVIIIIGPHKEVLRRYIEEPAFRKSICKDPTRAERVIYSLRIHFLYQMEPTGEADAIALAEEITAGEDIAILYPDNVHIPPGQALRHLYQVYKNCGHDVIGLTRMTAPLARATSNAGRVRLNPYKEGLFIIREFLPKGPGHFILREKNEMRTCGFSIAGPHIYRYIERARRFHREGEFIDIAFRALMVKEKTILGVPLPGLVYDVGNPEGYRLCDKKLSSLTASSKAERPLH